MRKQTSHQKLNNAIGNNIRNRRKALKYSQEEFAEHIGLDRANYGAIERGERNITIVTLARIAIGLEIQVGDLFPSLNDKSEL
jgi:transcriptional regulator with XRE-family HTH domain